MSKEKSWKFWNQIYRCVLDYTSEHPPPPLSAGGGVKLLPRFQKGGLERTLTLRGRLLEKRGVTFSRVGRGCNFTQKNKQIKSEIFNEKKKFKNKNIFLSFLRIQIGKGGAWTVCRFKRGLARKRGLVFLKRDWYPDAHYDYHLQSDSITIWPAEFQKLLKMTSGNRF